MSDTIEISNATNATNIQWWLGDASGSGIASGVLGNLDPSGLPPQAVVSGLNSGETYQAWMGNVGSGNATFPVIKPGQEIELSVVIE